jgi:hypothetical protein
MANSPETLSHNQRTKQTRLNNGQPNTAKPLLSSHIAPFGTSTHLEYRYSSWPQQCVALGKTALAKHDAAIGSLLAGDHKSWPMVSDPFSGTLGSLFIDYIEAGTMYQLRIGVASIQEDDNLALYRFFLNRLDHESTRSVEGTSSVTQSSLLAQLRGRYTARQAEAKWRWALSQISSDPSAKILRTRSRVFEGFFSGQAVEVDNGRVDVFEDDTFQCSRQGDALKMVCTCNPDFAVQRD